MQEEIKALHANDTWDLVESLKGGKNGIPNRCVKSRLRIEISFCHEKFRSS